MFAEVEAAHPELKNKFERKLIPFRDFAPPERQQTEGFFPQPAQQEAAAEPAASVGAGGAGAAEELAAAQARAWLPPAEGSPRDRDRDRGRRGDHPGMPTDTSRHGRSRRSNTERGWPRDSAIRRVVTPRVPRATMNNVARGHLMPACVCPTDVSGPPP